MKGITMQSALLIAVLVMLSGVGGMFYIASGGDFVFEAGGAPSSTGATGGSGVLVTEQLPNTVTATLTARDKLNTTGAGGVQYVGADFTFLGTNDASKNEKFTANNVGNANTTTTLTWQGSYKVLASGASGYDGGINYPDIFDYTVTNKQPALVTYHVKTTKPQLQLWNVDNSNATSSFATDTQVNLSATVGESTFTAGGAPKNYEIRARTNVLWVEFGDQKAQGNTDYNGANIESSMKWCTNASTSRFDIQPSTDTVGIPQIASASSTQLCWKPTISKIGANAEVATKFSIALKSGQSFAPFGITLYDATAFLSNRDALTIKWGFNDDSSSYADVGAGNPTLCLTQGASAVC